MSFEKENFLRTKFVSYLQKLDPATAPRWGKMSVQQMIDRLLFPQKQKGSTRLID